MRLRRATVKRVLNTPVSEIFRRKTKIERKEEQLERSEKLRELFTALDIEMRAQGFGRFGEKELTKALQTRGLLPFTEKTGILEKGEFVYNLGVQTGRSNFFVFVKLEKGEGIEISWTNPQADEPSLKLKQEEIHLKRVISVKDSPEKVREVVKEIMEDSKKKLNFECRLSVHSHQAYLFKKEERVFDDGGSGIAIILRNLMRNNMDVFCPTPHNSSEKKMHEMLRVVCEKIGITYLPGFELTMPLESEKALNGPHMVVMCRDIEVSEKIKQDILDRRDPSIDAPPYFSGMTFSEMFPILQKYKKNGEIAIIAAHPIIQEFVWPGKGREFDMPLYITGLISAVETGLIELTDAIIYARRCSGIAIFNGVANGKPLKLRNKKLVLMIREQMKKVFGKLRVKLTQNAACTALGKAFSNAKMNTFYEPDCHSGGKAFFFGFTRVKLPGELMVRMKLSKRKPSSAEIIGGVEQGTVTTSAFVYAGVVGGEYKVIPAREPELNKWEQFKISVRRAWGYVKKFGKAGIIFILEGDWWRLGRMAK